MKKKNRVLMCCSELSVKGGMVSVVKNYLGYKNWDNYEIIYVPTHTEKNKLVVAIFFACAYIKILFLAIFGKISIAHLHTAERGSFFRKAILVRTLHKFGIKTILHHHAAEFEEFYASLNDKTKKFVIETLEMADLNIVLSKRLIPMISDKARKAKIRVLYNAVPTFESNPYNIKNRNCLFMGRLGKRKGIYDLLNSIKKIDEILPKDVQFYLCGDGEVEETKQYIDKLNIGNRIAYIGWVDGAKKKQILSRTAINILPSYNEGLPMSILEAMSYGIPNIATNIASIPEVIKPGVNGYLIEPGDIDSLAASIIELMANDSLRYEMGKNAFNLIANEFSLDNHICNLKQIYTDLLE